MEGEDKKYPFDVPVRPGSDSYGYFSNPESAGNGQELSQNAGNNFYPPRNKQILNTAIIMIVGVCALGLGFYQVYNNVSNPFAAITGGAPLTNTDLSQTDDQAAMQALKSKDTDGDGLSDYDELYIYNTSPYLTDSDGDGIPDGTEVKNGTDPNCPQGQNCFRTDTGTADTSTANVPTFQGVPPDTGNPSITAETVRTLLKQGGTPADVVDNMSDDDVLQLYSETLQENPDIINNVSQSGATVQTPAAAAGSSTGSANFSTGTLPTPNASGVDLNAFNVKSMDDLRNLTGAQIRTLMIQSGASADLLSSVNDDDLKTMFMSKLESNLGSGATSSAAAGSQ